IQQALLKFSHSLIASSTSCSFIAHFSGSGKPLSVPAGFFDLTLPLERPARHSAARIFVVFAAVPFNVFAEPLSCYSRIAPFHSI
ncbi:hypothetical protein P9214_04885, partial [Heyndrickxia coagulans]|uniref:hypothetical protein n=1 Tax=Heyndrickxia coagulans TaxID=1398 RepID=UPI002E1CD92F|nr:hypothetical protein [Heyndrickxia coagulans]